MAETFLSFKGQLLLDSGQLTGSFFHRTVVLICQHDQEGAFGLILNRPTDNTVADALVAELPDSLKEQKIYVGGPVQPTALSYLHSDSFIPGATVIPNLELGHSLEALTELGQSYSASKQVRLYAGYAGWAGGQLDDELKRKAWVTHSASLDLVFHANSSELWRIILREKEGWEYRLLAEMPDDLASN
jgi:putative transcriptional regulator